MTTLPPETWARAAAALLGVIGLIMLAARLLRRTPLATRSATRLVVADSLALDARRRVVVVRCDDREVLVLTGGPADVVLGWLPPR